MTGAQQHTRVHRGAVTGGAIFWVSVTLVAWCVGIFLVHLRPGAGLGKPSEKSARTPRYGYLEQSQFSSPPPELDRQGELLRLRSYGWADPQHRFARIPIERAKQLLLEQGQKP